MRTKFTDRYLRGLKPKAKRFQVMDSEVKGLGVVVFPSGVQSFFHVRKVMGRPDRRTLGPVGELTLDSARGVASGLNSKLADWRAKDCEGPSPLNVDRSKATFGELVEWYVTHRARSEREIRSRVSYVADWKGKPLTQISKADVIAAHERIGAENGHITANRVVQAIKRLYFYAEEIEWF